MLDKIPASIPSPVINYMNVPFISELFFLQIFSNYRSVDNFRPVLHCQSMRGLCYELISSAERNKRERERNGTWEKHTVY
jgi:hypothetical protein